MYFKTLRMKGFKSFVDDTKLEFEPGITAIVGPNGCGKSNVSDAIRWVLGEQRSKVLRGDKMEELIFNGSQARKQAGLAEVSITMSQLAGAVNKPGLSSYDEITVTRRLFRSGESEYKINKTPCRLKDIVDIFLDTGVNTKSFSVIEQAQVNRLVASKPLDRRYIIEEAAGVMKYKYRRQEALSKLESSKQNLVRINDIVRELASQMNTLNRQAKKAERYKSYKEEIRESGISILFYEFKHLKKDHEEAEKSLNTVKESEVRVAGKSSELKNRVETMRSEVLTGEKQNAEAAQAEFETRKGIEQDDHHIQLMKSQIEELDQKELSLSDELESLKEEITSISNLSEEKKIELEECAIYLAENEGKFQKNRENMRQKNLELNESQQLLEVSEKGIIDKIGAVSREKNRLSSVDARLESLYQRKGKLESEIEETTYLLNEKHEISITETALIDELELGLATKKTLLENITSEMGKVTEELNSVEREISSIREKLAGKSARLKSLEELKKGFEGYGQGVRAVMEHKEAGTLEGVRGVIVDTFETESQYETAIEAVLGDRLSGVIVDGPTHGFIATGVLKEKQQGKGVFIPMNPRGTGTVEYDAIDGVEVIGRAVDLIKVKEEYKPIAEYLLGDVIVVRSHEKALSVWNNNGIRCTLVTLDGEVLDPFGAIIGGRGKESGDGLLAKERQIRELREDVDELGTLLSEIEKKKPELKGKLEEFGEQKKELEFEIQEEQIRRKAGQRELTRIEEDKIRFERKLETLNIEMEQFASESGRMKEESRKLAEMISSLETEQQQLEESILTQKEAIKTKRAAFELLMEDQNRMEVEFTEQKGKRENLQSYIERLTRELEGLYSRIDRIESNRIQGQEKILTLNGSIEEKEKGIYRLSLEKDRQKENLVKIEEFLKEKRELLAELAKEAKEAEIKLEKLRGEVNGASLKLSEIRIRIDHLMKKGEDDYAVKIEEIDDEPDESFNEQDVRKRLDFLKGELERYGDVNLTAISEFESVSERHDFLKSQETDLVQSIENLEQTIERIDVKTTRMFAEAFEKISKNFSEIFRRLFRGGKAELILIQTENMKEPGIDITVQPPGKKQQNISLLSAGEKAMTAISLLFSVFLVKPSPFCLLDEVDAPLDESNIVRFKDMLNELSEKTQFIVITHNQKTMMDANMLYGITMEEDGVSKALSVALKEAEVPAGAVGAVDL